jgi:hypothetical protein
MFLRPAPESRVDIPGLVPSASGLRERLRAAAIHFVGSLVVAAAAALLVFVLWFPYPYRELSGGKELFLILVAVDVVIGPLITFAVFNRRKPRGELVRDLLVGVVLQLGALAYGVWTLSVARPVHVVFEVDRFRVVHAIEVDPAELPSAPPALRSLPWTGPTPLSLRPFRSAQEQADTTLAALAGISLSARPGLWQPYEAGRADVLRAAKPLQQLAQRFPEHRAAVEAVAAKSGRSIDRLAHLPLAARKSFGTAVIDAGTAELVGYLPIDSF